MGKVLVIVDMQRDFIDGSLGSRDAVSILPAASRKIHQRIADGWEILVTLDTHGNDYLATQEGQKLPIPHCIKGTSGWKLHPLIKDALKGISYQSFEKSTFGSETLIAYLKETQPETVEFIGLCTDICVASNAIATKIVLLDASISVDASCCAGTSISNHQAALATMASCQITITQEIQS